MFNLVRRSPCRIVAAIYAAAIVFGSIPPACSQTSEADVIQGIDASVAFRDQNLTSYTVTEHYSVFRNQEKVHPAAEMTVKTTYQKDSGKSYEVLNESGSELILKQVLGRVLDSEKTLTQPANRANAIITSANYTMHVRGREVVDGRDCIALSIAPRRSAQYLFRGDLWVDAQDYSIVQLAGVTAKSPTVLASPAQVSRHYTTVEGLPMATHATATSASWLLGQTTIDIEYTAYQMELHAAH
jgi:hypothetical protein